MLELLVLMLAAAEPEPQVVLPLARYDTLVTQRASKEPPTYTTIEAARFSGTFDTQVTLTLSGRASGAMAAVKVLGEEASLRSCTSRDAVLGRQPGGDVSLTPLAAKFEVTCVVGRAGEAVSLSLFNVLAVEGAVREGTVEIGAPAAGTQKVSITRVVAHQTSPEVEPLAPSAVGRFRLTVLPDETRFRWHIQVHNPNHQPADFVLPLRSNEHVERATPATKTMTAEALTFEVASGEVDLVLEGTMKGSSFSPPLPAAAHMVLLENDPLLRLEASSDGNRVSPADTGIATQHRGAQAFLLGADQHLSWVVNRLEPLQSTSYTVSSSTSTFFVGADGQALAQTEVKVSNEGAPALSMPLAATPVWAAVADTPVALTRDGLGRVYLPLALGAQTVSVQHRQALKVVPGLAFGRLEVPGVGTTVTASGVALRYSRGWVPLFEVFAGDSHSALPPFGDVLVLLGLSAWAAQLLGAWLKRRHAVALAALLGLIAWATPTGYWAVLVGVCAVTMVRVMPWLRRLELPVISASSLFGTVAVMGLGMAILVAGVTFFGDNIRVLFAQSANALAGDVEVRARTKPARSVDEPALATRYTGTPAKVDLPSGLRQTFLSQELVDATASTSCTVLLLDAAIVDVAKVLLDLVLLLALFRLRAPLLEGTKRLVERVALKPRANVQPA